MSRIDPEEPMTFGETRASLCVVLVVIALILGGAFALSRADLPFQTKERMDREAEQYQHMLDCESVEATLGEAEDCPADITLASDGQ